MILYFGGSDWEENMTKKKKILVVDDDPEIRQFLAIIMQDTSWEVLFADGAATGLRLAAEKTPDLILLDIFMPEMDGLEVLQHLRREPATEKVPVLILTAADKEDQLDKAVARGANDYLTKPVNIIRLYKTIDKLLSHKMS